MHLNTIATSTEPLDMTTTEEFASLVQSAADLGISHAPKVRYLSCHTVVNHIRLHYLEWGDPAAPPLVLLHGGNQSGHSWDLVSLHLADRYHIHALDHRGHGDSEWVRDAEYGPEPMARDALAFISQRGIKNPVVFGHSMGGRVTLTLTLAAPTTPRALVVVDTGPEVSGKGAEAISDFIAANVEFDNLDKFLERVVAYDPYRSRVHMERTLRYNLFQRADGKYVSKSDRVFHVPELRQRRAQRTNAMTLDQMKIIPCPTLIVRGGTSDVLAPDAAERFQKALPDGKLVTVPKCGHNVHSQNTQGFLDVVVPFLQGLQK